jgi:tetratricopeptide (TPR) repeat protein
MMANVHMERSEWDLAEKSLTDALALARRVGDRQGIAFQTVKLGQVARARGDQVYALTAYQEGLQIHEQLGMPSETEQVRQMIAALQGAIPSHPDPLQRLFSDARAASHRGDPDAAVAAQEQAVALFRERLVAQGGVSRDEQITLSVLLYNLAGYYSKVERHADAVRALEEVVVLDELTGHPDLAADRQALETARHMAALSPEERARLQQAAHAAAEPDVPVSSQQLSAGTNLYLAGLQEQLAALPLEQRTEADEALRELTKRLSGMPTEQPAQFLQSLQDGQRRQRIDSLADQARDGAIAALRGETPKGELATCIEEVAAQAAEGEQPGSPWAELALYLCAVVALLHGEPIPPVPAAYAAHMAVIQAEVKS